MPIGQLPMRQAGEGSDPHGMSPRVVVVVVGVVVVVTHPHGMASPALPHTSPGGHCPSPQSGSMRSPHDSSVTVVVLVVDTIVVVLLVGASVVVVVVVVTTGHGSGEHVPAPKSVPPSLAHSLGLRRAVSFTSSAPSRSE